MKFKKSTTHGLKTSGFAEELYNSSAVKRSTDPPLKGSRVASNLLSDFIILITAIFATICVLFFLDNPIISKICSISEKIITFGELFYFGIVILLLFFGLFKIFYELTPAKRKEIQEITEKFKDYNIFIENAGFKAQGESIEDPMLKKEIIEKAEEVVNNGQKNWVFRTHSLLDHVNYQIVSYDSKNKNIKLRYLNDGEMSFLKEKNKAKEESF